WVLSPARWASDPPSGRCSWLRWRCWCWCPRMTRDPRARGDRGMPVTRVPRGSGLKGGGPLRASRGVPCKSVSAEEAAREYLYEQVKLLQQRDVDALLERHYHPDAVLVTQRVAMRGHGALRDYFIQYLAALGDFAVDSIDLLSATDNAFLFEAKVTSALGRARVYDAF